MTYETFCGGVFETNCYLVSAPEGWILFDAPQGACDWVGSRDIDLKMLLLTHGHIDHVQDVDVTVGIEAHRARHAGSSIRRPDPPARPAADRAAQLGARFVNINLRIALLWRRDRTINDLCAYLRI